MSSRLCGCSFVRPGMTAGQGLALARRLGFTNVDLGLGGGNGHFRPEAVARDPDHFANQVRRDVERVGVQLNECFLLNFGWPINAPERELCQRTKELFTGICRFARAVGCRSVLVIPGPVHSELGEARSRELAIVNLLKLVAIASDYNLFVNVEADADSCVNTPEAADAMCQQVRGLGLTLDYSHFVFREVEPARVSRLHRHARHVHIRQASPGNIAQDFDRGAIDFRQVVRSMNDAGYRGLYCIEYLALDPTELAGGEAERRTLAARRELETYLAEPTHGK